MEFFEKSFLKIYPTAMLSAHTNKLSFVYDWATHKKGMVNHLKKNSPNYVL